MLIFIIWKQLNVTALQRYGVTAYSIFIGEVVNEKDINDYDSFRYYVVGLQMEGVDYTVKLVIGVKNGNVLWPCPHANRKGKTPQKYWRDKAPVCFQGVFW